MKVQVHIRVVGMVQGVGFRWFVKQAANRLGLTGFVRNLPDGSVEVVVEGERGLVGEMVSEVRRGPRWAQVNHVQVTERSYTGKFKEFSVRF